ncbi:hypothetical protein CEXT_93341, partial [Caerostris extrusa]
MRNSPGVRYYDGARMTMYGMLMALLFGAGRQRASFGEEHQNERGQM